MEVERKCMSWRLSVMHRLLKERGEFPCCAVILHIFSRCYWHRSHKSVLGGMLDGGQGGGRPRGSGCQEEEKAASLPVRSLQRLLHLAVLYSRSTSKELERSPPWFGGILLGAVKFTDKSSLFLPPTKPQAFSPIGVVPTYYGTWIHLLGRGEKSFA